MFAERSLEPAALAPYQPLLDASLIRRFYLDEMPELADAPLGMAILNLIQKSEEQAPTAACELIARAKTEIGDAALRADLIQFIETVIMYKVPRLSREEIQTMLKIHDIRESRVYQEAVEEGEQKGIGLGIEKAIAITKFAAKKIPAAEIATKLGVDVALVRKVIAAGAPKKGRK